MKRIIFLTLYAISAAAMAATAGDATPTSSLTAAQIVDRNVAARGGLETWRAVKTLTLSGKLDAGGKTNAELPFVMNMKRPNMSRLEITFADQKAVQVYDGSQGWKLRPFLGREEAEPYSPDEVKSARSWQELDGPLVDYVQKGTTVELLGRDAVEGHNAYKLRLTFNSGDQRQLWIDAESFLELKIDGEPRKLDGKLRKVALYYREYKMESGLNVPHVLETVVDSDKNVHKMKIEHVTVNKPLENNLFEKAQPMLSTASK